MEFTDEAEDEEQDDEVSEGSDQNNVLEVLPPKESTTSIPLAHDSNSSDNSKEVGPNNSLEAEDDYYKMLLEDCAKDCVYFDSAPQSVKETNEEVVLQSVKTDDSDDDGYGGYNEYGERDRGYYYCDGGYERKTSPMMSPIISPVTA
ncbi:hypothetical protein RhiirC2_764018 [Rhizophagus irregularis]|uniref:Uncharacterized protein n=1 Tax=Rhizophagus irregularis TaxID=588596 RepID=A0A2N1M6F3_9GLOM|nr:hypothetical protein RhiirC2_764018 [Rhizophagus irregularis]